MKMIYISTTTSPTIANQRNWGAKVATFVNDQSNNLPLGTKVTGGSINGVSNRHHHNSDPSQTLSIAMQVGSRDTSTHKDVD